MIPKKPAPDLIRGGRRFSDKIMHRKNSAPRGDVSRKRAGDQGQRRALATIPYP
jgi:hypothetical protein